MSSSSRFTMTLIGLALSGVVVSGCSGKKKTKATETSGATEQASYSASIVLPLTTSSQLALTGDEITSVDVTTFDMAGVELERSTAAVRTDTDGVSSAEILVNPMEITAVEVPGKDLGVLIPATSVKPSDAVQRPLTETGKNVIDAIKAIAPEHRPYVDPEVIGTLLPAGTKFDPSTMTNMVLAFTEKVKELPDEKRAEVFLKRLEINTDYKSVVKSGGNLDTAQAAEAFAARKIFVTENPTLAERPVIKFLTKPSDVIEADPVLIAKIPDAIREKSSGEALARQILATKVDLSNQRLDTSALSEMTDAMADVKAAVIVARRGSGVGSEQNMASVIETIAKRATAAEKPEDFKGDVFLAVISKVPELQSAFDAKRAEIAGLMCAQVMTTLVNDKTKECREARDGCEAMKLRQSGWRVTQSAGECSNSSSTSEPNQQCEQSETKMFQPRSEECQLAPDTCVSEKLKLYGWREMTENDGCKTKPLAPKICLQVEARLLKDPVSSRCKMIGNSCEKEELENSGWTNLSPDDVDSCIEDDVTANEGAGSLPGATSCLILNAPMVHLQTTQCVSARTTCEERELISKGFRRSLTITSCPSPDQGGSESFVCSQKITEMFNPNSLECREAKNTCEKSNLERVGWRPRAEGDKCSVIMDGLEFANKCGFNLEQTQGSDTLLYDYALTSLPITVSGTFMGVSFDITYQGSITGAASVGTGNFLNQFAVLSRSVYAPSDNSVMAPFGDLFFDGFATSHGQATAANLGFMLNSTSMTRQELAAIMKVNGEFQNMACASRVTKHQNLTRGEQVASIDFAPGLLSGFNPQASIYQLRKEIGINREINLSATISRTTMEPETVIGKTHVREVPSAFECGNITRNADIAYEIENIFPNGADKLGLFKSQKIYIDATNKKVIAMINQSDGINTNTQQPYPPVCYISDAGSATTGTP